MANISFKSITFPGLANKYQVPEISNDLMTQGKAADAKATGDALSALEDSMNDEVSAINESLGALDSLSIYTINESLWTQGTVSAAYGNVVDNEKRITQTDVMRLDGQTTKFVADNGYAFMVFKYAKDGTYVGALQTSGTFEKNSNVKLCTEYTINAVDTESYNYRLVLRKDNNEAITVSESSHLSAMMLNIASYIKQSAKKTSENPFKYTTYRFGGYGQGTSSVTSTGLYIDTNTLTTRAGSNIPVAVSGGVLVAKKGYKVSGRYLTSLKTEQVSVQGVTKDYYVDRIIYTNRKNTVNVIPKNAKYVALTIMKDDSTQNFTQNEIDNLYGTAFVYYSDDEIETLTNGKYVRIDLLKTIYPEYTDDQLLEEAMLIARACGAGAKILWDGSDINFSGITHYCYGFGGIDFNGSRIRMPDSNGLDIIEIIPEDSKTITAAYSEIHKSYTTNNSLKGKVFAMNAHYSGNADMCLGDRIGFDTVIYYTPTVKTSPDGIYETGDLYLEPLSGEVECQNVHDYPDTTFEIGNATILASETNNMTGLMYCYRSNVHLHDLVLTGQSTMTSGSTKAVAVFKYCTDIEIDHLSGVNPVKKDLSGYCLGLYMVSNVKVHDCFVGDTTSWGAIGGSHLLNSVFERCYFNRWDCHYAQYGYNIIRDSYFNFIAYGGAGYGILIMEKCTFMMQPVNSSTTITMRGDLVSVFDGDIIVRDCTFKPYAVTLSNFGIWTDGTTNQKPENSKITGAPKRQRILDNCEIPAGILRVFRIGTSAQADKSMYSNLTYKIKDCTISCSEGVFVAPSAGQTIKEAILEGCTIGNCLTTKNIVGCNIRASNCDLVTIDSDVPLMKLTAVGCIFSGVQSVSNFTDYALSGNIASDMASVNKHS